MNKIREPTPEEWMQLVREQVSRIEKLQDRIGFRNRLLLLSIGLNAMLAWGYIR